VTVILLCLVVVTVVDIIVPPLMMSRCCFVLHRFRCQPIWSGLVCCALLLPSRAGGLLAFHDVFGCRFGVSPCVPLNDDPIHGEISIRKMSAIRLLDEFAAVDDVCMFVACSVCPRTPVLQQDAAQRWHCCMTWLLCFRVPL
jgi:hypothetical protein